MTLSPLAGAVLPLPTVGSRRAERTPYATGSPLPVRLTLQATPPTGLQYALTSFWEERHSGRVQRTTVEKSLTLHYVPAGARLARLTYQAAPPVLRKPDLSAFEKAMLALAALYQHLELDVGPTGQLLALRNHADLLHTWEVVQQELVRRSGGGDEVTQALREAVTLLLQDPANVVASLRRDYTFAWLLPDLYGQRFEGGWRYWQPRCFARFFAAADLWFDERLELAGAPTATHATLHLRGQFDPTHTDLAAVAQQIAAERAAAGDAAPTTDPAAVHGEYEATYQLDVATGWPVALDASVRCQAGAGYSKEYFFRLEQVTAS